MYVLAWQTVSAPKRGLFRGLLRSNEGNKHQNNTCVSTETVRHDDANYTDSDVDDEKNDVDVMLMMTPIKVMCFERVM